MSKKKANAKKQAITQMHPSDGTFLQITPEELQNIIANALVQAEEQRKQIEKDKQEQERQQWRKEIGYKDYSKSKGIRAGLRGALNELKCGLKLLFMRYDKIKGYKTISASLSMGLSYHYLIACFISFLLSLLSVLATILIVFNLMPWYMVFPLISLSLCLFYNGLKYRLAYFEVTYIKDDNLILNILASHNSKITTIISMISVAIAVIAILK